MALLTKEHIIKINEDFPLIIGDFTNKELIEKELKTVARSKYAALENIIKKKQIKLGTLFVTSLIKFMMHTNLEENGVLKLLKRMRLKLL